ncbi:MAG: asparagine synthetase B family protein [Christensenellales bacterium]|jgi:asparagine synthase (glutamine-hydrolysing)
MNIMAVYHANRLSSIAAEGGLISIRKGRHVLSCVDLISDGDLMAGAVGWLRNRAALSRELGFQMVARTSALVVAAYRKWGMAYPAHLEGAVSTVLIDRSADRMLVTRDRMGDRRIFYCRHGKTCAVSDHPDALIKSPYASRIVDADGINELFALGPARTPGRTPYRDVFALEPGCALVADRSGVSVRPYYALEPRAHADDAAQTAQKVRDMLERAVDDILPFSGAVMLSGGLDSTVLAALMRERGDAPVAFSVDYEGDEEDFTGNVFQPERDREFAAQAAELYCAEHRLVTLGYDALYRALGDAADARGFPGMADIDSSLFLFAREIAAGAGAIVSGECADEVFLGYPWFAPDRLTLDHGFPWSGSMDIRRAILRRGLAEELCPEQYALTAFENAIDAVPVLPGEDADAARMRAMQLICIQFFMRNLQERALCMCEASSIAVYTPFSDDRLVEYVWNVPPEIKFMNGEVKGLLREAVKDLLPEPLLRRKKSPYPKTYSGLYTQQVRAGMDELLADETSPILRVLEPKVLRQLNDADLPASGLPWFGQLMSGPQMLAYILQVNDWMKKRRIEISL